MFAIELCNWSSVPSVAHARHHQSQDTKRSNDMWYVICVSVCYLLKINGFYSFAFNRIGFPIQSVWFQVKGENFIEWIDTIITSSDWMNERHFRLLLSSLCNTKMSTRTHKIKHWWTVLWWKFPTSLIHLIESTDVKQKITDESACLLFRISLYAFRCTTLICMPE